MMNLSPGIGSRSSSRVPSPASATAHLLYADLIASVTEGAPSMEDPTGAYASFTGTAGFATGCDSTASGANASVAPSSASG